MKKLIYLTLIAILFAFCKSTNSKVIKADTSTGSIIFQNQYQNEQVAGANAIRFIRDSVLIDGDKVTHIPDTIYFVPITYNVTDKKDTTGKTNLKTKAGQDSIITGYYPISRKDPSRILLVFEPSFTPIHLGPTLPNKPDSLHKAK